MLLFSVDNAAQCRGGKDIFTGVSLEVQTGEKVALVGPNGIGKSSLLRIIAGIDPPSAGTVKFYAPTRSGLLAQHYDDKISSTVGESLEEVCPENIPGRSVGEALSKFGFRGRKDQLIKKLSGGEKTRLQLARIWLEGADLLLLDEPTNHLDTDNLEWLERFMTESPDTVILVSHDRYFLDRTVHRVLELRADGIKSYPGNYSAYYQARLEQWARDEKCYLDQEKQAQKLKYAIEEQQVWAGKAHDRAARKAAEAGIKAGKVYYRTKAKKMDQRVKNTVKRLERLEKGRIERPHKDRAIGLSFTDGMRARNSILLAEGIVKAFDRPLFKYGNFSLNYGEKAALVGANGSGKTTLLRIIAGLEAPDAGKLWLSPSLRTGYLDQEMRHLDNNLSVIEEVAAVCPDRARVRQLLAGLLLTGDAVNKACSALSMGERVRVGLAKLLLGPYDLLLLDEPTNYLDIGSREKLEQALEAFGGSLIVVAHDRYLLERVAKTVWAIEDERIRIYQGSYSDYAGKGPHGKAAYGQGQTDRLALEIKKARLISELSLLDRGKNEAEYLRVEKEFLDTVRLLRK